MSPAGTSAFSGESQPDEERRRQALRLVVELPRRERCNLLLAALADSSWRVRKEALELLAAEPFDANLGDSLVELLRDRENAGLRNSAAEALARAGAAAVPTLARHVADPDPHVRKFMVDILGAVGEPSAWEAVAQALEDADGNVAAAAVEALGKLKSRQAVPALLQVLRSPRDLWVKYAALEAVAAIGEPVDASTLSEAAADPMLRQALYACLGAVGTGTVGSVLLAAVAESKGRGRDAALAALAAAAGRLAPPLRQKLDTEIRLLAGTALVDELGGVVESSASAPVRAGAALIVDTALERNRTLPAPEPAAAATVTPQPEAEVRMSEEEYRAVRDVVYAHSGLFFDRDSKYLLEKRLLPRLRLHGMSGFAQYCRFLGSAGAGEREVADIMDVLTTNETYFFRELFQLRALMDEILPEVREVKAKRGDRTLRIWSAGCSTGEEPYTVAMLLRDCWNDFAGWKVEVIGTDISNRVLQHARRGVYGRSSFRATEQAYIDRYFTPEGDGYSICDEIRSMVTLGHLNLADETRMSLLGKMDVILCRNVIIYFDQAAKKRVIGSFHRMLRDGGFLLLGHAESLMNLSTDFLLRHLRHDLVYQKPAEPHPGVP